MECTDPDLELREGGLCASLTSSTLLTKGEHGLSAKILLGRTTSIIWNKAVEKHLTERVIIVFIIKWQKGGGVSKYVGIIQCHFVNKYGSD